MLHLEYTTFQSFLNIFVNLAHRIIRILSSISGSSKSKCVYEEQAVTQSSDKEASLLFLFLVLVFTEDFDIRKERRKISVLS